MKNPTRTGSWSFVVVIILMGACEALYGWSWEKMMLGTLLGLAFPGISILMDTYSKLKCFLEIELPVIRKKLDK